MLLRYSACLLILSLFGTSAEANGWERVFAEENVVVELRPYAGSALHEIRGVIRVDASTDTVLALLKDAAYNREWVYRSGGATILEETGCEQAYVHGIVDAPWPIKDRDAVVRFDYSRQAGSGEVMISIRNFPAFIPPLDGYVRVPDFGGFWRLRPLPDGGVEVTYQVYGDPGGMVPVWLANRAARVSVTRTLQNMPAALMHYHDAPHPCSDSKGGFP